MSWRVGVLCILYLKVKSLNSITGFFSISQLLFLKSRHKTAGKAITVRIISGIYFKSITNIGKKPTVSNQEKLSIETHILDFTGDLYGQVITLLFRGFIRSEKKFNSIKELRQQIVRDIASVKTEQKRAGLTSANNMI